VSLHYTSLLSTGHLDQMDKKLLTTEFNGKPLYCYLPREIHQKFVLQSINTPAVSLDF